MATWLGTLLGTVSGSCHFLVSRWKRHMSESMVTWIRSAAFRSGETLETPPNQPTLNNFSIETYGFGGPFQETPKEFQFLVSSSNKRYPFLRCRADDPRLAPPSYSILQPFFTLIRIPTGRWSQHVAMNIDSHQIWWQINGNVNSLELPSWNT
jgi:hypothetical protein